MGKMASRYPASIWQVILPNERHIDHVTEGDLEKNAKLWYKEVEPSILGNYWDKDDPAGAAVENMYRIMRVKAGEETPEAENKARQIKWEELICVMEHLERMVGWAPQDGTQTYTSDAAASHKSRVLGESKHTIHDLIAGEGYRTFDKSGQSDR
jgi:hypothetical protein